MSPVTNAIVLPTIYGQVIVNRHDVNQTLYLLQTGAAIDHQEIEVISQLVEPGTAAIDVGACFGLWTLAFAQRAAAVYSFEAQRHLYNCICGTLALNSLDHVYPFNIAIGVSDGKISVPQYDYSQNFQFGCVYLCPRTTQGDMPDSIGSEQIGLLALDSIQFPTVSVIKIDVEGMELEVLQGAVHLIERDRPVLYIETVVLRRELFEKFLEPFGYLFTGNTDNMLALPAEKYSLESLEGGKIQISRRPTN
jgi:FkbM family methyltransferase